jgi:phytoene synthase
MDVDGVPGGAADEERGLMSTGASNFFVAFKVLPPDRRRAIEAVYFFCRQADDAVDDAADALEARERLDLVSARLERAFGSTPLQSPDADLRWAIERFDLPRKPFDDLVEGVSWDLSGRRYEDTAELREYCYRVASTVGLLCVRIFGCRGDSCDGYAAELGIAMQWTNILRDVGSDLRRDRLYLPLGTLRRSGLTEEDLRRADPASREKLAAVVREEAAYAESRYREAELLLPAEEKPKVVAGEIMAAVYREILRRVKREGDGVLDRKVRISRLRRGMIASRILLGRRLQRGGGAV